MIKSHPEFLIEGNISVEEAAKPMIAHGKYTKLIEKLEELEEGKCLSFRPPFTVAQGRAFRQAARSARIKLTMRNDKDRTLAWVAGRF